MTLDVNAAIIRANVSAKQLSDKDHRDLIRMTISRTIVTGYLLNRKWYNPQFDPTKKKATPSLADAWSYFEHFILPRRLVVANSRAPCYKQAQPGSIRPSVLYSPWSLPESELSQWGDAMPLYFATLRFLAFIFLVLGFLNLANVLYFSSQAYIQDLQGQADLKIRLKGTAICTNRQWVPCPNCEPSQWRLHPTAFATHFSSGLNFVQRNACTNGASVTQGMINYASMLFMILSLIALGFYQKRLANKLDQNVLSATDYSVCVRNPPPDAKDPELWRRFFNQFESNNKQVVAVTIALKNGILIQELIKRRRMRKNLREKLGSHINLDDPNHVQNSIAPQADVGIATSSAPRTQPSPAASPEISPSPASQLLRKLFFKVFGLLRKLFFKAFGLLRKLFFKAFGWTWVLTQQEMKDNMKGLEDKIRELQEQEYPVAQVFVTFETQAGQKNALKSLAAVKPIIWFNLKNLVQCEWLFQDRVLHVVKPKEPNSILWTNLGLSTWDKYCRRIGVITCFLCLIALDVYIVYIARQKFGPKFAAYLLTSFNFVIPFLIRQTANYLFPSHEDNYQLFLFCYSVLFRWINTVFVLFIITPFTRTLTDANEDLLPQIGTLLCNEIWLTPLLRYLDIWGNFYKHIWAPRCRTQEAMNSCFKSQTDHLGERYSDFMRILLLVCFCSPIYPSAYLFGAFSLMLKYGIDKFRSLRSWPWQAMIGGVLAERNHTFFSSLLIIICTIFASYFWTGFSFDNVCGEFLYSLSLVSHR